MTDAEALSRLDVMPDYDPGGGPGPCVHTLRASGPVLLGAAWRLADIEHIICVHGAAAAPPDMERMGHGLVVYDDHGPIFIATKPEE